MCKSLQINKPLVSVNWLYQHLDATNLVVLNGTLPKVALKENQSILVDNQIPNTRFFDIKKEFSIQGAQFPNTALKPVDFQEKARKLGINKDSCIVVYDEYGIYSSARVWWLFKTMGFDNVAVLDGGFPLWKTHEFPVEKKQTHFYSKGNFTANYNQELLINAANVLAAVSDSKKQILDARSSDRFFSLVSEPRAELRSGHIPNSKNLPYTSLLNGTILKSTEDIEKLFTALKVEKKQLIFSCGSGVTACVLALGATLLGCNNVAVYDGSWTEWGSLQYLPIEK